MSEEDTFMSIRAIETLRLGEFPNLIWVSVEDSDGTVGLGETHLNASAIEAYIHDVAAPKILGQDPVAVDAVRRRLQPYVGYQAPGAEVRANSAIDIALWDLWGRRTGQPVWRLLGGRVREAIRTYNTCAGYRYIRSAEGQASSNWGVGQQSEGPFEDLDAFLTDAGALAESLLDSGITGMKIWPFDRFAEATEGAGISPADLAAGSEPFAKIRKAVGKHMQIMLECHSLWSAPAARDIAQALAPFDLTWMEDPIPVNNLAALADLRRRVPMKITASETLATRAQFAALMAAGATDIVMFDIGWCGGLTEGKAIASIAESFALPIAPHDCVGPVVWAASCHLAVNAPNAMIQESVRAFYTGWYRELVDALPEVQNGMVAPPQGAGLGLSLQEGVRERPDAVIRRSS
ncbi:MAG: mandelate racemase/muconate lactonizing enzyme family protein [Burkholderiaceae bacterium]